MVHDREVVVEHIIPKFFDHKKWRSFVSCEETNGIGSWLNYYLFYGVSNNVVCLLRAFPVLLDPSAELMGIQTRAT